MGRWSWVSLVVLVGCFNEPGGEDPQDDDGSTSSLTTSGPLSTSGPAESSSGSPGTTFADSSSSGFGGTTFADSSSSSTGEPPDTTSTGPDSMCPDGTVEIGSLCLVPLSVADVFTVAEPKGLTPTLEMCILAECPGAVPLGGGFVLDGTRAFGSHVDAGMDAWRTCGAPEGGVDDGSWQAYARCAVTEGDVFVNSEVYEVDNLTGPSCYDAGCPEGTAVVGGGGRWGPNFRFQGAQPDESGAVWQVCGSGGDGDSTVEVDAHCAVLPVGSSITVSADVVPVDAGEQGCALATCESGRAIAGGSFVGITAVVRASHPEGGDAQGWTACGRVDGNFTVDVRSRVMCLQE